MLVATPGQTTAYSILHNNTSNGGGSNSTAAATSTNKKSSTINSTNNTVSVAGKISNSNNNHTVSNKNSINSNTHATTFNYHQNTKSDNAVPNKLSNQNKATATASREIISSSVAAATIHSLKNENSTNNTNTTTTTKQSFIQTLKDSVQKALISTTGSSSGNNSINHKYSTNNKLQNNCNNSTTSIHNVTSSLSSTSHNANKVTTTTSSNNSKNSITAATQSSSAASAVRGKHFSCSLSKLHTVAPTVIHRYPEERQHAGSTDSLQKEMCHFKPIRIVPKTPWKSGSKSRGNCLRFPKANLATKKSEFALKSNCDVNNKKRKQQQNRTQNDKINVNEDDVDNNEQENNEIHGIYKPKPSLTCLSTSFTTPSHQSAFVCLVAQMKSLVNLRAKGQQLTTSKAAAVSIVELESDEDSLKELYMYKKQKPAKKQQKITEELKQLPNIRSRRSTTYVASVKQPNTKSNDIAKVPAVAITKAKSRRNLGRAKSKTVNMVAMANTKAKEKLHSSVSMPAVATNRTENITAASKNTRKRKIAQEDLLATMSSSPSPTKSTSIKSFTQGARKSSRLSTQNSRATSSSTNKQLFNKTPRIVSQQNSIKSTQKSPKKPTSILRFSPPLTRSRLKHLAEQGKIVTSATTNTYNIKNRKM